MHKSTVYYHTRKKFGKRIPQLTINDNPTLCFGELLGLFASDGNFYFERKSYHYSLSFSLSPYQGEYAHIMAQVILKVFGKKPNWWRDKRGVIILRIRGKPIEATLRKFMSWSGRRTYTISFKNIAFQKGRPLMRGIIRGLIAGDGSIYVPRSRLHFGVTSKKLALQYSTMLSVFGIPNRMYSTDYLGKKTMYNVTVTGRGNLKKFKSGIGLTDPAKHRQLVSAILRR